MFDMQEKQTIPNQNSRSDYYWEIMAINGYSALPRFPGLEPRHQVQLSVK